MRLDRLDPQQQMALVVVDPARIQRPVAQRWLVWLGLPEVERHRRLDVVVLDADEGAS